LVYSIFVKITFRFILLILWIGSIFFILNVDVLAQPVLKEKAETKNFGKSLKKYSKKSDADSKNKEKKSENTNEDETIRVETNLVVCDVLVLDKQGRAIQGLKQSDFVVTEDDNRQEISIFSLGDDAKIPRSFVLIFDYSGSQLPYIENSVEAAKVLVDKLNAKDTMAIVTDDVELLQEFTRDKILLKEKLEELKRKALRRKFGASQQYSALLATLNEMFDEEDVRPIIIFQTDGDQYRSIPSENTPPPKTSATSIYAQKFYIPFTFEELRSAVEKSRATVYNVIPGLPLVGLSPEERLKKNRPIIEIQLKKQQKELEKKGFLYKIPEGFADSVIERLYQDQSALFGLSKLSGGFSEILEKPEQADEIYSRILFGINRRYVIGYYPNTLANSNKIRKVKIEVRNHPEYIVWGRKTYFDAQKER
jgi:VWFA-related protein